MNIIELARNASGQTAQMAARIEAELDFAQWIAKRQPALPLSRALASARTLANEIFLTADTGRIRSGIAEIELLLAPFGRLAKQYTIYAVGHAHIDMNWMWGWPETVAVTNDTFGTVLKLMEEFPTFYFSQSQAAVYRIIERYNPALLRKIRRRVKEGRWEITASHWVEGDRNMVSGESLTRHILYTRNYLKKIFGTEFGDVQIDWSPDTFGHPLSVPMYLNCGGVKYVYLHRPGALGPVRPQAFWWKSPDDSRVLVRNDMDNGYNGTFAPGVVTPLKKFAETTGLKFVMFVYGVGDHGGGPTRHDLATAIEMDSWPIFPNIKFSRAQEFFTRLEKEGAALPVLSCELNTEVTGCYTTQALIKRSNRIAEHRLLDAETACVLASAVTGRDYPGGEFEEAWRDTLFCHFHDILPGSNVHDSRTWMHGLFQKTIATTSMAETLALREIAADIDTRVPGIKPEIPPANSLRAVTGAGAGWGADRHMITHADSSGGGPRSVVVFNPTAWSRTEIIEETVWADSPQGQITDEMRNRPITVRSPAGTRIEAQKLEFGTYWGHSFVRIAFPVTVPALGYATYNVLEESSPTAKRIATQITPPHHCFYLMQERRPEGLKNDLLQLEIDPLTGGIRELKDLRSGKSLVGGTPWSLEYALEKPHSMSAWLIDNVVEVAQPQVLAIDRKLDGPHKASVDVKLKIKDSEFTLTYELRAGDPKLYLHLLGTWFERGIPETGVPTLRFAMRLKLKDIKVVYEIPFGQIERDLTKGEEVSSLNFAIATGRSEGKQGGLMLLNDCKHGHSLDGADWRLTLIRSSYNPDPLPDVGQHEIHLALMPLQGDLPPFAAMAAGKEFNRPLRTVTTPLHEGRLPAIARGVEVKGNVVLTGIKQAEDGKGLIIQVMNPSTQEVAFAIILNPKLLGTFTKACSVDLMELPVAKSRLVRIKGGQFKANVPGNRVAAFRFLR